MNAPPRVVITGPPAAGKTAVRRAVVGRLGDLGHRVQEVAVDDVLRELYPAGGESAAYAYDADGALLLHRPAEQIPPAVRAAAERCRRAGAPGGFVLELAGNECAALLEHGADLLAGGLVFALSAPVELRSRRNAQRRETLIPDDRLRRYPDELPAARVRACGDAGAEVIAVDGSRPLETVLGEVLDALARRYAPVPE